MANESVSDAVRPISQEIQVALVVPLLWRQSERDSASNQRLLYCLLNRLFRRR